MGLSNECLSGRFLAYSRSHPTATGIAAGDISNPPDRHRGQLACVVQNREREGGGGGVSDLEQGDTTNERAVAAAVVALRLTRKQSQLVFAMSYEFKDSFLNV